jgi:hypothetical protein
MRRIRFTIANLLFIVLFLGVSFAALREASAIWESAVFSAVLGAVLLSIVRAIQSTSGRRAFWLGFAICGGLYLWLSMIPAIEFRLVTTHALLYLDAKLPGRADLYQQLIGGAGGFIQQTGFDLIFTDPVQPTTWNVTNRPGAVWATQNGVLVPVLNIKSALFVHIGHSLLAVIAGCVGGWLSRYWYARQERTANPAAAIPASETAALARAAFGSD